MGGGEGRGWGHPHATLLSLGRKFSLPSLPHVSCTPVKYFMHLSGAFCKHFYIFYMLTCLPSCFAGSRWWWWWYADCVDCERCTIACLPAWLPPREIRNNPANRKSATSQVRCHKRHKELERNQSVVVLIAIYVAVAFAAQVVQISWWNKKNPTKFVWLKKKTAETTSSLKWKGRRFDELTLRKAWG